MLWFMNSNYYVSKVRKLSFLFFFKKEKSLSYLAHPWHLFAIHENISLNFLKLILEIVTCHIRGT